jgi:outer membrane protein OmpA-like peptidoglycan-associated protein
MHFRFELAELRRFEEAFDKLPLVILAAVQEKLGGENVQVDDKTGDVSIGDRILFDENSSALREEGKDFLREFIPLYSQVIFSEPEFDQQISYVVVEGHTSSAGVDEANRALSLNRALAVSNFIFSEEMNFPTREKFQEKVLSAGRGEVDARQDIDDPSDRRVLFRFQFRRQDFSELTQQGATLEQSVQEYQQ